MPRTKSAPSSRKSIVKKREKKMFKEMRELQNRVTNIISKAPFCRVLKEILGEHGEFRITTVALTALQEACEMYLTHLFSDAYLLTYHRDKVTLSKQDIELVLYIRSNSVQ